VYPFCIALCNLFCGSVLLSVLIFAVGFGRVERGTYLKHLANPLIQRLLYVGFCLHYFTTVYQVVLYGAHILCGTMRCALNSTSTGYCMLTTILYPVPHDTFMNLSLFRTKVDVGTCTWYLVSVLIVVLTNI
jgi:hypothetical protein